MLDPFPIFTDATTLNRVEPIGLPRSERLRETIEFLKYPSPRSTTTMQGLLTASEFRTYKQARGFCFPRPTPEEKAVLRRYNFDLRRGDSLYERGKKLPRVGLKAMKRHLLITQAQSHYCHGHEMLGELLSQSSLAYLFDRPWEDGGGQMEEPEGMPRRTDSSSEYLLHASLHPATANIAELQRGFLRDSLAALDSHG